MRGLLSKLSHERCNACTAASMISLLQVTHDISDICSAEFLSEVGRKTPIHTRFSTVVHESGSPESLRDTRGFSVKFYTNEGNWDFVGNNMPVSNTFLAYFGSWLQIMC